MSELFTGITFPQQKVTPSDDAAIRKAALADSILSGCALSYAGSTLTMGPGLLLGCGRQFRHTAVQNWAVTGATSGYARLVLTIDTTRASTKDSFDQVVDTIEYASALDGFLQLQQDDINEAGTIYQMAVCVVSLGAGGITGMVQTLPRSAIKAAWLWNLVDNGDFSQFVAPAGIGGKHGNQDYAGDRWILVSGTVTGEANENGNGYKNITLNGTIRQKIANPPAVGTAGVEMISGTATVTYENGEVTVTSNGGVIGFVKLFEGEYTADNMPKAQPKGYGVEVVNCNGGATSMELLWENASPSSEFVAQTIQLDVYRYSFVMVIFQHSSGNTLKASVVAPVNNKIMLSMANSDTKNNTIAREAEVTYESVYFNNGYAANVKENYVVIPIAIYGIKGVSA